MLWRNWNSGVLARIIFVSLEFLTFLMSSYVEPLIFASAVITSFLGPPVKGKLCKIVSEIGWGSEGRRRMRECGQSFGQVNGQLKNVLFLFGILNGPFGIFISVFWAFLYPTWSFFWPFGNFGPYDLPMVESPTLSWFPFFFPLLLGKVFFGLLWAFSALQMDFLGLFCCNLGG